MAAIAAGLAIAFHEKNWPIGVAGAMLAYAALAISYALLARACGWPRLRWPQFFAALLEFFWAF